MSHIETTSLNVVCLPDSEITKQAIHLSSEVSKLAESNYTLDGIKYFPHITLYQSAFPTKNIDSIKSALTSLANQIRPLDIRMNNLSVLLEFLFWDAVKTPELLALQSAVVAALNPFREGSLLSEDRQRLDMPDFPQVMKDNIQTYGYPLIGDLYSPHISLTRFTDSTLALKAQRQLETPSMQFTVSSLHLANRGPDGTVNKIFENYQLT